MVRLRVEQRPHVAEDAGGQRRLDEDQRLVGKRRMEKRIAPPIFLEPAPQVVPSLNLMDGFVLDQPFENQRGCSPVDTLEHEEAAVEPGAEQMNQVGVDRGPSGCSARVRSRSARICTSIRVPPGAVFSRRNSSWRRDSVAGVKRAQAARPRERQPGRRRWRRLTAFASAA